MNSVLNTKSETKYSQHILTQHAKTDHWVLLAFFQTVQILKNTQLVNSLKYFYFHYLRKIQVQYSS